MSLALIRTPPAPNRDRALLESIAAAQLRVAEVGPVREVFDGLLDDLLRLTDSEYGFIGEVFHDEGGRYLKTHAITNIAWNDETQRFYQAHVAQGLEFRNLETLFGHTLRTGEVVITNDAAAHASARGTPEGHPPLLSFLGLPFHAAGELVGMVGIANRSSGYDQDLVDFLHPFVLTCGTIVATLRSRGAQERAMRSLAEGEAFSRAVLENAIDAIIAIDTMGSIQAINDAALTMFGYVRDELEGANVSVLMPEPHRGRHDGYVAEYLDGRPPRVIGKRRVVPTVRKDGQVRECELAVNPIELDGRRLFVGALRDVTEQRRQEEERARLTVELSRRVDELDALDRDNSLFTELVSFLQACHREEEMYEVVSTFGASLFTSGEGGFFLTSSEGRASPAASFRQRPVTELPYFDKRDCWALRRGEPHLRRQGHHGRLRCRHTGEEEAVTLCVPVMSQDGAVGLLVLGWDEPPSASVLDRSRRLMSALADRLGAAVANVRLRHRLEAGE